MEEQEREEEKKLLTDDDMEKIVDREGRTTKLEKIYLEFKDYKAKVIEFVTNLYHCILIMMCFLAIATYKCFQYDQNMEAILALLGTIVMAKLAKTLPRENPDLIKNIRETYFGGKK